MRNSPPTPLFLRTKIEGGGYCWTIGYEGDVSRLTEGELINNFKRRKIWKFTAKLKQSLRKA
jgi:hypothetical protein